MPYILGSPAAPAGGPPDLAENGQDIVIVTAFVTAGLIIAWHRPSARHFRAAAAHIILGKC